MKINISQLDFDKLNGLIPAVIVDNNNHQVLMLGFVNKESLDKTIKTSNVTFYSRSKKSLWTKGETSGNYLKVVDILADCDNDTLLVYAEPQGPTCHTGNYSCFNINNIRPLNFLNELFDLIKERKKELPENSYTAGLFREGESRIIQKVGEEAIETVIAAKNKDKNEIINETSDLIYHLFVMLADQGIDFGDIVDNLRIRRSVKSK